MTDAIVGESHTEFFAGADHGLTLFVPRQRPRLLWRRRSRRSALAAGSWASDAPAAPSISGLLAAPCISNDEFTRRTMQAMICLFTNAILAVNAAPRCPPGAAFFTSEAERTAGAGGLALVGWKEGGPDRGVTTGRVGGDRDRALLRRGPEENASASACVTAAAIMLWWKLLRGRPAKRTSGLLTPPGFTDRQRTPLYRPAECGTVPAAVLFCCAVSW